MAYQNFIPNVWNAGIDRELERLCVFVEDCNTKYEGTVKKLGESVTILGVGKPTIKRIAKANRNQDIDGPEEIQDTSVIMYINQIAYFNYLVGDIDKAQATEGVMEALEQETSEALANEVDKHISSCAVDSSVPKLYGNTPVKVVAKESEVAEGSEYVLDIIDKAIEKLQENDVKIDSTKIVITLSPRFYRLFKKAYRIEDTDNSKILKNGKVCDYGNVIVKLSNNTCRTNSAGAIVEEKNRANSDIDNIMIRTQRAIAFAKPLTHTEPYRPERKFADAVKGFILFDAKVVRPKEIININVKYE